MIDPLKRKESQKRYNRGPKMRAAQKRYRTSAKGKARDERQAVSPLRRAWYRLYSKSEKRKTYEKGPVCRTNVKKQYTLYRGRKRQADVGDKRYMAFVAWLLDKFVNCYWCGVKISKTADHDHLQPVSRGGKNRVENVQASCRSCNTSKQAMTSAEFAFYRRVRGLVVVHDDSAKRAFYQEIGFQIPALI